MHNIFLLRPDFSLEVEGQPSGQGFGLWLACHEFESSTTKDLLFRRELKHPPVGVVWEFGEEGASSGVILVT
ncbi:hypothetical protein TNCV_4697611 [Trichonephila clavipes]|nr:hypothetical protein TNCV_4697611 [Trichonephila clavipes]